MLSNCISFPYICQMIPAFDTTHFYSSTAAPASSTQSPQGPLPLQLAVDISQNVAVSKYMQGFLAAVFFFFCHESRSHSKGEKKNCTWLQFVRNLLDILGHELLSPVTFQDWFNVFVYSLASLRTGLCTGQCAAWLFSRHKYLPALLINSYFKFRDCTKNTSSVRTGEGFLFCFFLLTDG